MGNLKKYMHVVSLDIKAIEDIGPIMCLMNIDIDLLDFMLITNIKFDYNICNKFIVVYYKYFGTTYNSNISINLNKTFNELGLENMGDGAFDRVNLEFGFFDGDQFDFGEDNDNIMVTPYAFRFYLLDVITREHRYDEYFIKLDMLKTQFLIYLTYRYQMKCEELEEKSIIFKMKETIKEPFRDLKDYIKSKVNKK